MNTKRLMAAAVVAGGVGMAGFSYAFFKVPAAPSGPVRAIPIDTPAPQLAAPAASATALDAPAAPDTPPAAALLLEIVPGESEARFLIDEVLNGADKRVVGATGQVAGQIALDAARPGASEVGAISINARTLTTDSEFRDRAVRNRILHTDVHEYITFQPTSTIGLDAPVTAGELTQFQIVGELSIAGTVQVVTFDVTATLVAPDQLDGEARTIIRYQDFGLAIPSVRQVTAVSDEVTLELTFVARPPA